jgi:hypothetical protein
MDDSSSCRTYSLHKDSMQRENRVLLIYLALFPIAIRCWNGWM